MFSPGCARWIIGLLGLFLGVFALAALCGPGRIDTVDAQTRYEVARSLVEHGDSIIRDKGAWFNVYEGRNGENYSLYRIPQSALGVPAIWAADWTAPEASGAAQEMRRHFFFLLTSAFCGAVLAVTYAVWFRHLGHSPAASLLWAGAGILCTPSFFYSCTTFDDIVGTFAIVVAVAAAWIGKRRVPVFAASVAGIAMAWAVNSKQPLGLFVLPVLAALYQPELSWRKQLLPWATVLFWVGVGCAACVLYERYKFPPGTTDPNAEFAKNYGSIYTPNPLPGLVSFALSPSCGIFLYFPAAYLAIRGWCNWREKETVFCWAMVLSSGLFMLFLSFITFFKGEHGWGPRYLTPMFALWWLFVPAAVSHVRRFVLRGILATGVVIELLGLSVDPTRLFLATPIPLDYFLHDPWLTFHGSLSHLMQRPREIAEVVAAHEPAPEFAPAPLATHAGGLHDIHTVIVSEMVAASFAPQPRHLDPWVNTYLITLESRQETARVLPDLYKGTARRYHIYNSLRPWWLSQQVLSRQDRPVDIERTLALLLILGAAAVLLAWLAVRKSATGAGGESSATVSGSMSRFAGNSGGIAALNHRLISGTLIGVHSTIPSRSPTSSQS
jgi:hypothetical protein